MVWLAALSGPRWERAKSRERAPNEMETPPCVTLPDTQLQQEVPIQMRGTLWKFHAQYYENQLRTLVFKWLAHYAPQWVFSRSLPYYKTTPLLSAKQSKSLHRP